MMAFNGQMTRRILGILSYEEKFYSSESLKGQNMQLYHLFWLKATSFYRRAKSATPKCISNTFLRQRFDLGRNSYITLDFFQLLKV